jgi:hypothetical protein
VWFGSACDQHEPSEQIVPAELAGLCLPGEALQLVGTVVDCCYLTAEVFRTILLAGSPTSAGTAQVQRL